MYRFVVNTCPPPPPHAVRYIQTQSCADTTADEIGPINGIDLRPNNQQLMCENDKENRKSQIKLHHDELKKNVMNQ